MTTQKVDGLEVLCAEPSGPCRAAPPLVWVHGAFAGAWVWAETFLPFFAAQGYRCYALSLRGHGHSQGQEDMPWHSIADYVSDVATVVDWLGEPAVLIGHSMGGFVVQKYLERRTAPGVVLLCSVPPQGLVTAQWYLLAERPRLFLELNQLLEGGRPSVNMAREALFSGAVDEMVVQGFVSRMQPESYRALWDMSVLNLAWLPWLSYPPMLVCGAQNDVLVPAFLVRETACAYGQEAHIFPDMGHAVMYEPAWPQVAEAVKDWLERLPT